LIFNSTKGHLLKILEEAEKGPALLWIDELNRANVPRVFGDLISLIGNDDPPTLQILNAGLEDNKIELTSNQVKNLHIVATMNTSDRSVTPLDAALRRRFSFRRLEPMTKEELIRTNGMFSNAEIQNHLNCFLRLNDVIQKSMGEDAILGHSYLFDMLDKEAPKQTNEIEMIWKFSILPNIIDNLMLTQNFDILNEINGALETFRIPFRLESLGHGLGKMILVGGVRND
jgi:5-methylcytosine-specific restriction endonuclease McrBC GTP-binding regulatory subunit McrB